MGKTYEMVIGLEVHVELATKTKIFCSCSTEFGALENAQTCPVCMGLPGSLPVLNKKVVDYAVAAGIATNCKITRYSKQDRKNYFYPDLAKAYQVSQYDLPLCEEGFIEIETETGSKKIRINRIHIEEDAGKLIHTESGGSLIDYNRAGVPLIEIVSEPDIRSAQEAKEYLSKLRSVLKYSEISDCKMNEGSFRCDVNLSVREKGKEELGTRTEMKNLNSFSFIVKAIESEFKRQVEVIESGEKVVQETRRWDEGKGKSFSMRTKEDAHDYRYFPDPDLPPILISEKMIHDIGKSLPALPDERKLLYMKEYNLTSYEADQIVSEKEIANYFEEAVKAYKNPKLIANLIMTDIFKLLGKEEDETIPFSPKNLAILAKRIDEDIISQSMAKKVIEKMFKSNLSPDEIIEKDDLRQITDKDLLEEIGHSVIKEEEEAVKSYLSGREKALQSIVGSLMKKTKGKASPKLAQDIIKELIEKFYLE
ncbi:aspartyl-tRNA(Asn)/glutamyl-tRNA(Gln) amidotransferase subunit B [Acetoanaerobium pronyense]|uniref:Aspartyl/glutamyl-tRNA(Asn/Gln) amidotransferase subunit B n=1 Tax=Acetoanaerobium pronyense TaxID=1482736 RepID=A0ABS4KI68_9FIRM|nr:Asp-tRNA(Asn)/Glu-tRNA(Gln) amidotransferase subunit GatB [Acetoanaerobium pronyense]MBP2027475.1 aspartyl-tRNA(Asn)/glutamyl-tRNA(Gln) amidotransferase subunit B [Acetoanaerobium pronyense]